MSSHPRRSGAISAELFAAFCKQIMDPVGNCTLDFPRDYLKHRIMDAALDIARCRAARKFRWAPNYSPALTVDIAGYVHYKVSEGLLATQAVWIAEEVSKISRKALAALEGAS